jgi:hypothetical protein
MGKSADPLSAEATSRFQRREWAVQRGGWVVLSTLLVASAAGLFGQGPLARAEIGDSRGWQLEYDRFARNYSQTRLAITSPAGHEGDTVVVWIDRDYADHVEIQESDPAPVSVSARSDRLVYRFLAAGPGPVRIVFNMEPQTAGRLRGRVGFADSDGVAFSQLVYP